MLCSLLAGIIFPIGFSSAQTANPLSINPAKATIKVGETVELQSFFEAPMPPCPEGLNCPQVMPRRELVQATWTSSNPKIASVEYRNTCPPGVYCLVGPDYLTAVVTGVSQGAATITATYKDSSATAFVTVGVAFVA